MAGKFYSPDEFNRDLAVFADYPEIQAQLRQVYKTKYLPKNSPQGQRSDGFESLPGMVKAITSGADSGAISSLGNMAEGALSSTGLREFAGSSKPLEYQPNGFWEEVAQGTAHAVSDLPIFAPLALLPGAVPAVLGAGAVGAGSTALHNQAATGHATGGLRQSFATNAAGAAIAGPFTRVAGTVGGRVAGKFGQFIGQGLGGAVGFPMGDAAVKSFEQGKLVLPSPQEAARDVAIGMVTHGLAAPAHAAGAKVAKAVGAKAPVMPDLGEVSPFYEAPTEADVAAATPEAKVADHAVDPKAAGKQAKKLRNNLASKFVKPMLRQQAEAKAAALQQQAVEAENAAIDAQIRQAAETRKAQLEAEARKLQFDNPFEAGLTQRVQELAGEHEATKQRVAFLDQLARDPNTDPTVAKAAQDALAQALQRLDLIRRSYDVVNGSLETIKGDQAIIDQGAVRAQHDILEQQRRISNPEKFRLPGNEGTTDPEALYGDWVDTPKPDFVAPKLARGTDGIKPEDNMQWVNGAEDAIQGTGDRAMADAMARQSRQGGEVAKAPSTPLSKDEVVRLSNQIDGTVARETAYGHSRPGAIEAEQAKAAQEHEAALKQQEQAFVKETTDRINTELQRRHDEAMAAARKQRDNNLLPPASEAGHTGHEILSVAKLLNMTPDEAVRHLKETIARVEGEKKADRRQAQVKQAHANAKETKQAAKNLRDRIDNREVVRKELLAVKDHPDYNKLPKAIRDVIDEYATRRRGMVERLPESFAAEERAAAKAKKQAPKEPEAKTAKEGPGAKKSQGAEKGGKSLAKKLLEDERGSAPVDMPIELVKNLSKFLREGLKTSVEGIKGINEKAGVAAHHLAAAKNYARYLSHEWTKYVQDGLNDRQKELLGRYLVHLRADSIEARIRDHNDKLAAHAKTLEMQLEQAKAHGKKGEAQKNLRQQINDLRNALIEDPTQVRVPRLSKAELAEVKGDPALQEALRRHKETVQPILEKIRRNLGLKTIQETEDMLFIRLKALREGDDAIYGISADGTVIKSGKIKAKEGQGGKSLSAKPRLAGTDTHTARGTGYAYETDYGELIRHALSRDMFNYRRKQFIETLQKEGLAVKADDKAAIEALRAKHGDLEPVELRAPSIDTLDEESGLVAHEGQRTDTWYMPKRVANEYQSIVAPRKSPLFDSPGGMALAAFNGKLTGIYLKTPVEATAHGWRELNILSKAPIAKDTVGTVIKNLVPYFGPRLEAARQIADAFSPVEAGGKTIEASEIADRLARAGGLPMRTLHNITNGEANFAHKALDLVGMNFFAKHVFDFPMDTSHSNPLDPRSYSGFDIRTRLAAAKLYLKLKPHATDAELADYANQFGNYVNELQGELTKGAKKVGLTFASFQSQAIPTELARMLGNHGIDASHLTKTQQAKLFAATIWSGSLGTALATAAINMALNQGQDKRNPNGNPLMMPGLKFGDIRLPRYFFGQDTYKLTGGKPLIVPSYSIDPSGARAGRFLPVRAGIESMRGKPSDYKRDVVNDLMSLTGPVIRLMAAGLVNAVMYVSRGNKLIQVTPDGAPDWMRALNTGLKVNPALENAAKAAYPPLDTSEDYPKNRTAAVAMRAWDTFSPVQVKVGQSDSEARMQDVNGKIRSLRDKAQYQMKQKR